MKLLPLLRRGILIATLVAASPVRSDCPDLALVLAIDASASINKQEYALQIQGYAAALASPQVQHALWAAGRVTIGVVLWGDSSMPVQILPPRSTGTLFEAMALGEAMLTAPRRTSGNTGLGRGLAEAVRLLETTAPCALRRVIDVSGDGKESFSPRARDRIEVRVARDRAAALGITVNGLAVTNEAADIAEYYRREVITGHGAFVEEVDGFDGFAAAILRKLVREITPPVLASLTP
jgi:Protein of unknown function (DUF1194)